MVVYYYEVTRGTSYMEEIWRDIEGYEGIYQVSNIGRIRSLDTYVNSGYGSVRLRRGALLIPNIKRGYSTIGLSKNGSRRWYQIHRLVGQVFIPNPNNHPCINHKDENKINNNIENLEWCTYQYNNVYGNRLVGWGGIIGKKLSKVVIQCDMEGNFIKKWDSMTSAEEFGFRQGAISNCCSGRTNSHKGYKWTYEGGNVNG